MSVVKQNKFGFLVHPLPPTPHMHYELTSKPYGKCSFALGKDSSENEKKRKKKRSRTIPLNAGEASMMIYHDKIRQRLLNGWKSLVEVGREAKYFPVVLARKDNEELEIDAALSHSSEALEKDKETVFKSNCASCTYDNIDLVDICNRAALMPTPTDYKSFILIDTGLTHDYTIDTLCGKVVVNCMENWTVIKHSDLSFAIPPNCTFLLSDIKQFQSLINYVQCDKNKRYDCVVLDPPWENRSAIRSHRYDWLSEHDLLQLPLPGLCNDGCLVVVWVTNKVRFADFVRDELFPSWSVKPIGEWHWIKVTTAGELVFGLDSLHKKPYELLILGNYQGKECSTFITPDGTSSAKKLKLSPAVKEPIMIPPDQLIVSIPTQYHSQKPYLGNVLDRYLPQNANCLEMFARNLHPGWTLWGNEVLKFQLVCK